MKNLFLTLSTILFSFFPFGAADAATLYFVPESGEFRAGQDIVVEFKADSDGQAFNAAQASVQFSKDTLQVKAIDYSPTSSIFNFWLENPAFSNTDGNISFIGGTTNGISGKSIPLLKIIFVAKGAGEAALTLSDTAITASDGSGTNILETMRPAIFKIVPETVTPQPVLPVPVRIERTPVAATRLPTAPVLSVPLYSDSSQWHNLISDFLVQWTLPADISGISTALNDNPQFVPQAASEGLFDSKMFRGLKNGVQYLHVRFRNTVGWGPTAHYRLAIDTVPPLPFKVESKDGFKTDNPSPTLSFATNDSISGIMHYIAHVDTGDEVTSLKGEFITPLLPPGLHRIVIRAFDRAGNFTEDAVDMDIIPLPAPVVGFVSRLVLFGEPVFASGKTEPGLGIFARLTDGKSQEVFSGKGTSDTVGNWELIIKNPLSGGRYALTVTAVDERGAQSYPVAAEMVTIRTKPVLSLGPIDLGWFEILLIVIVLTVSGMAIAGQYYISEKKTREAYRIIVGRDIDKFYNLLSDSVKDLEGFKEPRDSVSFVRASASVRKIQETIEKLRKYLRQEIDDIR
ncbi:MAG TPA: cohesin domain-containing protein [Candidatus Paceibacterota bacterium]